jgi:diaminopimelate epimerase
MARFLVELQNKGDEAEISYSISTLAGRIVPKITKDSITVDMGKPVLVPEKIPTLLSATKDGYAIK